MSDVVVVGSGAAALSAALTVAASGGTVRILERSNLFGGTSAISGGGMWLPGNGLDPDYTEDLAGARKYLGRLTLGLIADAVLDRFVAEAGNIPAFFSANSPLSFSADIGRPDYHSPWEGSSLTSRTVFPGIYEMPRLGEMSERVRRPGPGGIVPLGHSEEGLAGKGPDAVNRLIEERLATGIALRGLALVGGLIEGCLDKGVVFDSGTRVRSLLVDDGRVVGVRAEGPDGERACHATRGVVIACGGFEWNQSLWKGFVGVPWDGPASPPWNEGDGLIMAAEVGAKLANLDKVSWIPTRYLGEEYDGHQYSRVGLGAAYAGEIMVNSRGRRFANENLNYNDLGPYIVGLDTATYEYPNHPAFAIGDKRGIDRVRGMSTAKVVSGETRPDRGDDLVEASTLREVAEGLGIDPESLEQQVSEFNAYVANDEDLQFHSGERPWDVHCVVEAGQPPIVLAPISEPPFYGYRVRAGVFGTRGGPVIDEYARIVDYRDDPIPGLYGAGNAIAHPFGSAYPGGGGTLGPAVTFGHVAAKSIMAG